MLTEGDCMKLGFIGTGVISEAVITGLVLGGYKYERIIVSKRSAHISSDLASRFQNIEVFEDNQQIADQSDILFLAVLPQKAKEILSGLTIKAETLVISLIATVTDAELRDWTGTRAKIARAVPLPFSRDGRGATPVFPPEPAAMEIFNTMGRAIPVETIDQLDALTASGTFMGTFFGLQKCLTDWLVTKNVTDADAREYIAAIFLGLSETGAASTYKSLPALIEGHSTPGGLNEQVYKVFAQAGGLDALQKGIDAVYQRIVSARRA